MTTRRATIVATAAACLGLLSPTAGEAETTVLKLGTVHMFEGSTGAVGRFLPQLEAFAHPYVWRDTDHMLKVVRGEIGQELARKLLEQHGMRILDMGWLFGHRHLTTRGKPVRTPDDMRGLKIRVQP